MSVKKHLVVYVFGYIEEGNVFLLHSKCDYMGKESSSDIQVVTVLKNRKAPVSRMLNMVRKRDFRFSNAGDHLVSLEDGPTPTHLSRVCPPPSSLRTVTAPSPHTPYRCREAQP